MKKECEKCGYLLENHKFGSDKCPEISIEVKCLRCNDNGCPACDGAKGDKHNPKPY